MNERNWREWGEGRNEYEYLASGIANESKKRKEKAIDGASPFPFILANSLISLHFPHFLPPNMVFLFHLLQLLFLFAFCSSPVNSLVDNGILGEPYVDCGGNHMEVRFDTRNTFRGLVFVEGHLDDPQCRSNPVDEETGAAGGGAVRNAQIRLDFRSCGVNYTRHADPKGVFLSARLVVAFHPQYLSKFDRLYELRCFYMEMEHQLEKELTVTMAPPVMQTKQVPMPVCKYEVLSGGPEGPPVYFATIGQMVYHKWTCESSEENQFCMIVHSCIVDDGHGDRVELLDEQGCAKDKYLLQNLDYISDLMVGKEAHVYKYADRESMFFDCKITLSIKEPGSQYCPVPQCPDPPRRRHHRRHRMHRRHLAMDGAANGTTNEGGNEEEELGIEGNLEGEMEEEGCIGPVGLIAIVPLNALMLVGGILLVRDGLKQFRIPSGQ